MERFLVLALFIGLLTGLVAGQTEMSTFESDVKELHVEENVTLNATLTNPLSVQDTLVVVFGGPAITKGLVRPEYEDSNNITCDALQHRCSVDMAADQERDVQIKLQGTAMGQEILTGTVNSTITQLSSTDRVEIRVDPYFEPVTVSAPGMQGLQVVLMVILASILAGFFSRH
ncbi:MAG: hypothetical protein MUP63_04235 [Candidatus Nanohaloarchaeota archaeon QJJ-7]|nr:hypothetical protein [Candidatus Nanohaloarchaeota archaeon QJJ-7]